MELHAIEEMAKSMTPSLSDQNKEAEMPSHHPTSVFPAVTPPGMAYVPYQQWGDFYETEMGFRNGTMFPVLDFPFQKSGGGSSK